MPVVVTSYVHGSDWRPIAARISSVISIDSATCSGQRAARGDAAATLGLTFILDALGIGYRC